MSKSLSEITLEEYRFMQRVRVPLKEYKILESLEIINGEMFLYQSLPIECRRIIMSWLADIAQRLIKNVGRKDIHPKILERFDGFILTNSYAKEEDLNFWGTEIERIIHDKYN